MNRLTKEEKQVLKDLFESGDLFGLYELEKILSSKNQGLKKVVKVINLNTSLYDSNENFYKKEEEYINAKIDLLKSYDLLDND
jgi:hypothetical protein